MSILIEAACGCHLGRIRGNNEDNLYFNGRTLEQDNCGLRHPVTGKFAMDRDNCFAVFDGMGGEEAGEAASYIAAQTMKYSIEISKGFVVSPYSLLEDICKKMNMKICDASKSLDWGRMGSTMACLYFTNDEVYACNIGDSRSFRLRDSEWLQLSEDHTECLPPGLNTGRHKPRLTQHLGVFPDELTLEPHIAKGDVRRSDQYLLCSDGLTDMLTNVEICATLKAVENTKRCVEALIEKALENGGRDNITVILCRIG